MIPSELLTPEVGVHGIAVYAVLAAHADRHGVCWPAQDTIAKRLGISRTTVHETVRRLADLGFLTIESQAHNGMKRSNRYVLTDLAKRSQPANVRMYSTEATLSPTATTDVSVDDNRCTPSEHELEPSELEPSEHGMPTAPKPRAKTKAPLSENFAPTEEMIVAAMEKHRLTRQAVEAKTERMRNWALGNGELKADWNATWRNFMAPGRFDSPGEQPKKSLDEPWVFRGA